MALRLRLFVVGLALVFGVAYSAEAVTLDREGKAPPPSWFTCHKDISLIKAGGKPDFDIELKGYCGTHPGDGLPGWTAIDWKEVKVYGEYNYETGVSTETIWAGPEIMIEAELQCEKNPWAHGNKCTPTKAVVNNTGVNVIWDYPLSAQRMSYSQRQAIAKWETTPDPATLLADWNPYSPKGQSELAIVEPNLSSPIPENSSFFAIDLSSANAQSNWVIDLEWAKIMPPKDPSIEIGGKWLSNVPASAPNSINWSQLPGQILVQNSFSPGLYAVRVKVDGSPDNTKTDWKMFWVGEPTEALMPYAKGGGGQFQQLDTSKIKGVVVFDGAGQQEMGSEAALKLLNTKSVAKKRGGFTGQGVDNPTAARGIAPNTATPKGAKIAPALGKTSPAKRSAPTVVRMPAPLSRESETEAEATAKIRDLSPPVSAPPREMEEQTVVPEKRISPATNGGTLRPLPSQ